MASHKYRFKDFKNPCHSHSSELPLSSSIPSLSERGKSKDRNIKDFDAMKRYFHSENFNANNTKKLPY